MDPLAQNYSDQSVFVGIANNPISFTDPNGEHIYISIINQGKNKPVLVHIHVTAYLRDETNSLSPNDMTTLSNAIAHGVSYVFNNVSSGNYQVSASVDIILDPNSISISSNTMLLPNLTSSAHYDDRGNLRTPFFVRDFSGTIHKDQYDANGKIIQTNAAAEIRGTYMQININFAKEYLNNPNNKLLKNNSLTRSMSIDPVFQQFNILLYENYTEMTRTMGHEFGHMLGLIHPDEYLGKPDIAISRNSYTSEVYKMSSSDALKLNFDFNNLMSSSSYTSGIYLDDIQIEKIISNPETEYKSKTNN